MAKHCDEGADRESEGRDDLVEAGRKLRKAMEGRESNLGVKARGQRWRNRYPKSAKVRQR